MEPLFKDKNLLNDHNKSDNNESNIHDILNSINQIIEFNEIDKKTDPEILENSEITEINVDFNSNFQDFNQSKYEYCTNKEINISHNKMENIKEIKQEINQYRPIGSLNADMMVDLIFQDWLKMKGTPIIKDAIFSYLDLYFDVNKKEIEQIIAQKISTANIENTLLNYYKTQEFTTLLDKSIKNTIIESFIKNMQNQ